MNKLMIFIFLAILNFVAACTDAPVNNTANEEVKTTHHNTSVEDNSDKPTNTMIKPPRKGGPAEIVFNVKNMNESQASLIGFFAESHFKADTSTVDNGKIIFKNPEGYDQGLYYISIGSGNYAQFMLGEDQQFEISFDAQDIMNTISISGSLENDLFYKNIKYEQDFNERFAAVNDGLKAQEEGSPKYNSLKDAKEVLEKERLEVLNKLFTNHPDLLFSKFKRAGQNPTIRKDLDDKAQVYHFRKEFWDNVDFSDERLIRTPVINNKLKRYIKELTPQNADSIVFYAKRLIDKTLQYPEYFKYFSNWVVLEYEVGKTTIMDAEAIFVNITKEYFTRERAFWADSMEVYAIINRGREMGNSLVGQQGPNITVPGIDGSPKTLFDSEAEYLVVYMYTPTCEHCMEETPKLVKWYNENKDKGFDVYAIALDTDIQEWKDYVAKNNMTFTNVHDPSNRSIYATYFVDVTPEIYLLNKDRIIIGKNLKTFQIETMVNKDKEKKK